MNSTETTKSLSRKEAIKLFCYQCSGENKAEVHRCPAKNCPLWVFRKGKEITSE